MKTLYRSLALAISMLTAAFILSSNAVAAPSFTVDVAPDETTFDSMREPADDAAMPTGPFYIQGPIFPNGTLNADGSIPEGASPIGTFHCWGWIYDGAAGKGAISQIFAIDGRGEIHIQGLETFDANRAVTGGTGEFIGARGVGHYNYLNLPDSFSFHVTFDLRKH